MIPSTPRERPPLDILYPPPDTESLKGDTTLGPGREEAVIIRPDQGPHARREPREHLTVPVGCRLLDVADSRSRKMVFGETKNLSNGGARVSLSGPFPLMSRVEVSLWIGGLKFQGRAEVVNAEAHPTHEGYRHSLRWMGLTPDEQGALSRAILDAAFVRSGATIRREMPQA